MKKIMNPILSSRDIEVLKFLWRHRIATFQGLKMIFYPELTKLQTYRSILRLRASEFIRAEPLVSTKYLVLCLAPRGFQYLKSNHLPELRTKMYKPHQQIHDLLVQAALLGAWAKDLPACARIVTEQEILAFEPHEIHGKLSETMDRRPDGIWLFDRGERQVAVALEVEITDKSSSRYEKICSTYSREIFFRNVIWIVPSKTLANKILTAGNRFGMPRKGLHLFILRGEFEKQGWDASFINTGKSDTTLAEYLNRLAGVTEKPTTGGLSEDDRREIEGSPNKKISQTLLDCSFSLEVLNSLEASKKLKIA